MNRSVQTLFLLCLLYAALAAALPASAQEAYQSEEHAYRAVPVVEGLNHPWGMAFLPSGDILVTEKPGKLRVIRDGTLDPEPIAGVPEVAYGGQGGLLDVSLHPGFAENRLVYLSYSKPGPKGATTAVVRGRLEGSRLVGVEEVFEADAWNDTGKHFGSRIAWDRDGYMYLSVGDRRRPEMNAQDLTIHNGKILRLHDDGRVPADNPFAGHPTARPEIYSYGHRNPQGLIVHPETGEVWAVEHGPRGGDELNLVRPGRNYGWPVITYGINYDGTKITDLTEKEGMEQPVHYWVPSIATSGLAVYTGDRFPQWKGDLFVGGLAGLHLARLTMDGDKATRTERLLTTFLGRIRDVEDGPDGYLYVLLDAPDAPLLRLEPAQDS